MNTILPNYIHIVNPKLKNIYLYINGDGEIVIKSPKVSLQQIEKFIISKTFWIKKRKEKILNKKGKVEFKDESISIFYLGKKIDIILQESKKNRIEFIEDNFKLFFTNKSKERLSKSIDAFYMQRAKLTLPVIVDKWSQIMKLTPTRLKFRKTKSQWGSCNSKNEICLNSSLMKLPPHLIDYVIIHELCHIKHKHHQKSFWDEVGIFCPNFKEYKKELKEFSV